MIYKAALSILRAAFLCSLPEKYHKLGNECYKLPCRNNPQAL